MATDFSEWLNGELQARNWSQSDLSRNAKISRTSISNVISGARNPGPDLCESIAKAFKLSPETVFRAAGLLPPADPLIASDHNHPLDRGDLAKILRRLGDRAGVPNVHAHRFRHTFAITYLRNGGDVYSLQTILGHSTLDMTRRYLAIAQVDINAAHRRASPVENCGLGR